MKICERDRTVGYFVILITKKLKLKRLRERLKIIVAFDFKG